jgi:hypothetical protein
MGDYEMTDQNARTDPGTYALRLGVQLRGDLQMYAALRGVRPSELARQLVAQGVAELRAADLRATQEPPVNGGGNSDA